MVIFKKRLLGLTVVLALIALVNPAGAALIDIVPFDVPGVTNTVGVGINNAGVISGYAYTSLFEEFGFVTPDRVNFTPIQVPGATRTIAYKVNDNGQIVGTYYLPPPPVTNPFIGHGFLYNGANFTKFDVPGAGMTEARGVNNAGEIVGFFEEVGIGLHGFFYDGLDFKTLDVPGATNTFANDINNHGQIVGTFTRPGPDFNFSGFLYDINSKHYTILDAGSGTRTTAFGINDNGIVVGTSDIDFGFVYAGGIYDTDLMVNGFSTTLSDINDSGRIVGSYNGDDGNSHGFTAAIPLPPGLVLLGSGLLGLVGWRKKLMVRMAIKRLSHG